MNERTYKHADLAAVFGVSRQTIFNWSPGQPTRREVQEWVNERLREVERLSGAWAALNDRMDAEDRLRNVSVAVPES